MLEEILFSAARAEPPTCNVPAGGQNYTAGEIKIASRQEPALTYWIVYTYVAGT